MIQIGLAAVPYHKSRCRGFHCGKFCSCIPCNARMLDRTSPASSVGRAWGSISGSWVWAPRWAKFYAPGFTPLGCHNKASLLWWHILNLQLANNIVHVLWQPVVIWLVLGSLLSFKKASTARLVVKCRPCLILIVGLLFFLNIISSRSALGIFSTRPFDLFWG